VPGWASVVLAVLVLVLLVLAVLVLAVLVSAVLVLASAVLAVLVLALLVLVMTVWGWWDTKCPQVLCSLQGSTPDWSRMTYRRCSTHRAP
jgi:hypothetical protein